MEIDFEYKTGINLLIHNQSDFPYMLIGWINIEAGARAYIGIIRTFTSHLEKPCTNCLKDLVTDDTDLKRYFGYLTNLRVDSYQRELCFINFAQDRVLKQCGCLDVTTPTISNASYC